MARIHWTVSVTRRWRADRGPGGRRTGRAGRGGGRRPQGIADGAARPRGAHRGRPGRCSPTYRPTCGGTHPLGAAVDGAVRRAHVNGRRAGGAARCGRGARRRGSPGRRGDRQRQPGSGADRRGARCAHDPRSANPSRDPRHPPPAQFPAPHRASPTAEAHFPKRISPDRIRPLFPLDPPADQSDQITGSHNESIRHTTPPQSPQSRSV